MEIVHNSKKRMPTILNEDLAYEWLFGKLDEKRISEIALTQYPYQEMDAYTLQKDFRNALNPLEAFARLRGRRPRPCSFWRPRGSGPGCAAPGNSCGGSRPDRAATYPSTRTRSAQRVPFQ